MNKRRVISGILSVCLIILSISMTFAVESITLDVNGKAQALNKLGMLAGDGKGNYSLSSNLKRSEAATFIVKLMGKNQFVNDNREQYINTDFVDVQSSEWYASYVGFCKENSIISGIGDNKFGPASNVTEKAFLTMTMKALGYASDDFGWGDVYQKAFEIGLVTDEEYRSKTVDNIQYTRAEVVEVMYKALGLKIKGSEYSLIKKLILDGQVKQAKAVEAGLAFDELPSAISQITVQSGEWINVKFNEPISGITDKDIKIYERTRKALLNFKIISQTDTELKIKTDSQTASLEYVLEATNIIDSEENVVKKLVSGFIGYENKEMKSDLFQISKVEQRSNNEIAVYFTHPVNINAEQADFYSILQSGSTLIEGNKSNLSAKVMEDKTNVVIINSKEFLFQPDVEYTIKLKGSLISAYGTNLGLEAGDQKNFIAKDMQTEKLKLVGINSLNNKSIQLDFNRQVNKITAEQVFSYYITEITVGTPIQIIKASTTDNSYGMDCAVILTVAGSLDSKTAYNILINSISDVTKQFKIEEQKFSFNATTQVNTDLKVTSILPIDLNCISISFDKKISQKQAEDISNYSILCLNNTSYNINPIKAIYSSDDPKSVRLYITHTKPMTAGYLYKVNISTNFQDYTGAKISTPIEYSFIANNVLKTKPEVIKAAFIAKDTVKINFSKDIALDSPNILTQNYYIQVINDESIKKIPLSINYIDKNTIVLKFDKIDFTNQYYFKYNEIKDITGEIYSGNQVNTAIVQGE